MENKAPVLETGERASEMDLSILIVNWNSGDFLRRCLESLEAQREEGVHFEVIVVDNASIDGSAEGLDRLFPWVKFIWNSYNYGFAKATNQAYRLSRGRYVMTLNPDTYLVSGSLRKIVEFFDTHPDAGAAQPYISYIYFNRWHRLFWWQVLRDKLIPPKPLTLSSSPIQSNWLWGTGIIARRTVLPSDRFYEEWTFLFCEEYDFCKSIRQAGYKLYVIPLFMEHFVGGSRKRSYQIQYIVQKLSHAAIYVMTSREFGTAQAWLNSFLKVLDGLVLWLGLSFIQLLRPKNERIPALIEWKALWTANIALLFMGESYFKRMNAEVEKRLNDQNLIRKFINVVSPESSP